MAGVKHITITDEEEGVRLDRWLKRHYPYYSQAQVQKFMRTGQIRLDGGRVKASARLMMGHIIRLPPMDDEPSPRAEVISEQDRRFMQSLVLYENDDLIALNKPTGLAVQGGSKTYRHVDGLLPALQTGDFRLRLTHRLDKDTSGILIVAKTPAAAARLAGDFQKHRIQKTYWAVTLGVPRPHKGFIKGFIKKGVCGGEERMMPAKHGEAGAQHAKTAYHVVMHAGRHAAWLVLQPETGRTHQLRLHLQLLGVPIAGDRKYGKEGVLLEGLQPRLHLHACQLEVPRSGRAPLRLTAPMPEHMRRAFELLGFDEKTAVRAF